MGSQVPSDECRKRRLEGKIALITGAARGIGAATARKFVANGARVIVTDVQDDPGKKIVKELGGDEYARYFHLDVTREEDFIVAIKYAIDTFGGLDILHNNAGLLGITGPIDEMPFDKWNKTLQLLVNSVLLGIKHAAKHMKTVRSGVIINTASMASVKAGIGPHCYTTAKHAVAGLTASAAVELRYWNIRVNAVGPGGVHTELLRECTAKLYGQDVVEALFDARQPFHELSEEKLRFYYMDPDEIADVVLFLASDESRGVNGHTLLVDRSLITSPSDPGVPEFMKQHHVLSGAVTS